MWQTFLSAKLFMFFFVLVENGVCLWYFSPPSSMIKTIQGDGVNVTFSFLSSLSCGMVWVEEQKNNACKFYFIFNFVVLVKKKMFLDKRALKMSKLSWNVVGDVGRKNTRLKVILLSDFNVHCVLYSIGNFCSLWTFLLKKEKKISNCIVQRDVIFGVLEMH